VGTRQNELSLVVLFKGIGGGVGESLVGMAYRTILDDPLLCELTGMGILVTIGATDVADGVGEVDLMAGSAWYGLMPVDKPEPCLGMIEGAGRFQAKK
jgi:hypothetical protein